MHRSTLALAPFALLVATAAGCGSLPESEYVAFEDLHEHLQSGIPWAVRTAGQREPGLVAQLPRRGDGSVAFEALRVRRNNLDALDKWWGEYVLWEQEVGVREASTSIANDPVGVDAVAAARRSRDAVYRQLLSILEARPK